jgi:hypothetical protein
MAIETPARIAVLGDVLRWGHVRMFTPFAMNRSTLGLGALRAQDPAWQPPDDDALLTGRQYAERYLLPLAASDLIVDGLHEHTEVVCVGRSGLLKGEHAGSQDREDSDFRLLLRSVDAEGHTRERFATAEAVIDATGTFGRHNWLGPDGLPAIGELAAREHVEYRLPDVLGAQHHHYASRNILLVGDGDSAAASLVALAELASTAPDTWVTWVTRSQADGSGGPVRALDDDPTAERRRVAAAANRLATSDADHVTHLGGTVVQAIAWHADLGRFVVRLGGKHAAEMEFDRAIANVGYRGDARLFAELDVELDPIGGAPRTHSGEHGPAILTDEPDFYVLGAKSRGRDSRFHIADGIDQVRALFSIIGDRADLDLYANVAMGS